MGFAIGDKVRFLREKGEGTVTRIISVYKVGVALTDGLEIEVNVAEICVVTTTSAQLLSSVYAPKELAVSKKRAEKFSKPHSSGEREVDLHIESIIENGYLMSNEKKLDVQIHHFRNELKRAINGHVNKITFIHGKGSGVLRQAIRDILKTCEGIEYSDGAYRNYGPYGATEVRIVARSKAGSFNKP